MTLRYTQKCFFQHTLMNILFTDLNEILHQQLKYFVLHQNVSEYA